MSEVTRRTFLQYLAVSAGLLALSRLRPPLLGAAPALGARGTLHVLSEKEANILRAVIKRMMRGDETTLPPVGETAAVETVDWVLAFADDVQRTQFRWLLRVFEWSPPWMLWRLQRFTALDANGQDRLLQAWERSRMGWARLGFRALKNLSALGYYSQEATWAAIGYRGPWVPRPPKSPRLVTVS